MVSIVNTLCTVSCLCLLDGHQGVSDLVTCEHGVLRVITLIMCMYVLLYVCMICCAVVSSSPWVCTCMSSDQGSNPIGLWSDHRFRFL